MLCKGIEPVIKIILEERWSAGAKLNFIKLYSKNTRLGQSGEAILASHGGLCSVKYVRWLPINNDSVSTFSQSHYISKNKVTTFCKAKPICRIILSSTLIEICVIYSSLTL
jgi:hypothetical protein